MSHCISAFLDSWCTYDTEQEKGTCQPAMIVTVKPQGTLLCVVQILQQIRRSCDIIERKTRYMFDPPSDPDSDDEAAVVFMSYLLFMLFVAC